MRVVFSHQNLAIVHSAKNILEMNGIDCLIQNEFSMTSGGNLGIGNTEAELCVVRAEDGAAAIAILDEEMSKSESKESWDCKHCGENNDGSFEICWSCRSPAEEV
jgi:hypothetical protein